MRTVIKFGLSGSGRFKEDVSSAGDEGDYHMVGYIENGWVVLNCETSIAQKNWVDQ